MLGERRRPNFATFNLIYAYFYCISLEQMKVAGAATAKNAFGRFRVSFGLSFRSILLPSLRCGRFDTTRPALGARRRMREYQGYRAGAPYFDEAMQRRRNFSFHR